MSFALFPPEVNSALMYSGAGAGPLLGAASEWSALAADLEATATSYQTAVTNLTTGPWVGPSATRMAAAAQPFIAWLQSTAAQAAQTGAQATAAAGAYETAFTGTVPPPVIAANRALLAALVATNILGQNTPAIAATEMHYLEMWIQDGLTMDTYAASSHHAAALPQHTPAPQVSSGSPGHLATSMQSMLTNATTQLTQHAATQPMAPMDDGGASGHAMSAAANSVPAHSLLNSLLPAASGSGSPPPLNSSALLPLQAAYYGAMMASMPARMLMGLGNSMNSASGAGLASSQSLLTNVAQLVDGKLQGILGGVSGQLRSFGSAISAQLASAHRLGGLSVPQTWQTAAPAMSRAAPVLPGTSVHAQTLSSGMGNSPFTQALMGALSGRGMGHLGGAKVPPKVVPRSPAGG